MYWGAPGTLEYDAEWIKAVANLKDPKTYGLLSDALVNARCRDQAFQALKDVPGLDLTAAAKEIWNRGDYEESELDSVACIAFQCGQLEAMDCLLDMMDKDVSSCQGLLSRHLEVRGDSKQLRAWLNQNRAKLRFDPKDKIYKGGGPLTKP